ncbi:YT521-B-like domain-containing protein [Mycena olivaceomarginata]|nr:YT521-B-like domain-containing protein [Mycena olivaceomarginata]
MSPVGPYSSPHFFPGHRWPAPPLPQHQYGAYGAQQPSVYQPAQYSHPAAHLFHAPREPPSASPITSTSVGAPVSPAGSSHGERRTGGAHGKVKEDSHKDRDKGKGRGIYRAQSFERQSYHPTPPVSRSDWVMWVGNVPRDAGHDEMWRFFAGGASSVAHGHGILSIFLIARSGCAFVNYSSSAALSAAIAQFDGVPLRAGSADRALECRQRHGDDDLRAGVGGQRGVGMHNHWVKDRRREWMDTESGADSKSERDTDKDKDASTLEASGLANPVSEHGSTSTSSSMLVRHFPQRFFILKSLSRVSFRLRFPLLPFLPKSPSLPSLTREDLDLSVRTGVWATQRHNESVLDRAFRTAADVVLIFSVNKSGEFYGWARMEGPVGQGKVAPWAPRGDQAAPAPTAVTHTPTHRPPIDPVRTVESAPALPASRSSARLAVRPVLKKQSLDPMVLRALDHPRAASPGIEKEEMGAPADTRNRDGGGRQEGEGESWGQNFPLHWMCTESLPFTRTKSVRNPWNHDRQVKIARDGTEIEPAVGHALIEQWSGSGADGMMEGLKLG